jgi:sarcosine oxidase, subunit beta
VELVGPTLASQPPTHSSASWTNAGGLRFQGAGVEIASLAIEASSRWPRLPEELGVDIGLRLWGSLHLAATEADVPRLAAQLEADRAHGMEVQVVSGREFSAIGAPLHPSVPVGNFLAIGGQADPRATTKAFRDAALHHGARSVTSLAVDLITNQGCVSGVITTDGTRLADLVVLAAGHWSTGLASGAGMDLPLRPAGAQMLLSDPVPQTVYPTISAVGRLLSLKQLPSREVMIGGGWPATVNPDGASCSTRPLSVARNLSNAALVAPWTAALEVVQAWCGIDGETPDHLPIVDQPQELPGLYLATGFSLGGFQLAPAVGRSVAAEIVGAKPQAELSGLRLARFANLGPAQMTEFRAHQRETPER